MQLSLHDKLGRRKYLTPQQRAEFIRAALRKGGAHGSFCLVLALTGARISEVLRLTCARVDVDDAAIIFETLKRRSRGVFRAVPVPDMVMRMLCNVHSIPNRMSADAGDRRLWPWCRTTAWKCVKDIGVSAGLPRQLVQPKALRHAFGINAVQEKIALTLIQRWLGHAKIETTAIYATPIGDEERALAKLLWSALPTETTGRKNP